MIGVYFFVDLGFFVWRFTIFAFLAEMSIGYFSGFLVSRSVLFLLFIHTSLPKEQIMSIKIGISAIFVDKIRAKMAPLKLKEICGGVEHGYFFAHPFNQYLFSTWFMPPLFMFAASRLP